MDFRKDADLIIKRAIRDVQPDQAVNKALASLKMPQGRLIVVSLGKAAWQMAKAAKDVLGDRIDAERYLEKSRTSPRYQHDHQILF